MHIKPTEFSYPQPLQDPRDMPMKSILRPQSLQITKQV